MRLKSALANDCVISIIVYFIEYPQIL